MGMLEGKRALILGVASNRSIAWGIAQAMHREGAEIALTYQNDRLADRVRKLGSQLGSDIAIGCDVAEDGEIDSLFGSLSEHWDGLDIVVHAVAFAPREELDGEYLSSVTRDGFRIAHDISAYSFTALAKGARQAMQGRSGALLTLSYLGAERVITNYNVMGPAKASLEASVRYLAASLGADGIRVNGISAGPIRTLAASGIANFRSFLEVAANIAPMGRNITIDEVGNVAAFLCSDLASGVTGEITHVDAGFNCMGI